MKAFELTTFAPNGNGLVLGERPAPMPGPGEAVIRMRAASVNYRDLVVTSGEYDPTMRLPLVPLSDGCGEVVALGEGVRRVAIGDRVCPSYIVDWTHGPPTADTVVRRLGGPLDGVLAELVKVPANTLVRIPDQLGDEEAATLPIAAVTAYRSLFNLAHVRPGDLVVVEGTGGVSLFALQLATAVGARVIVVGSRPDKLMRAKAMGAWATIDLGAQPAWHERVLELSSGRGADVVVEVVGGDNLHRATLALRIGGTLLLVGFLAGRAASLDIPAVLRRCITMHGVTVGSRDDLAATVDTIAALRIRPVIDRVIRFDQAPEALAYMARGGHFGKVVIRFS